MTVNPSPPARLSVTADRSSALPIGVQLREQLTWLIASRVLTPGDRLPSIRELAAALGVHHHTVRGVYRQLAADGLLAVRQGSLAKVRDFSSLQLARPRASAVGETIGVLIAGFDPFYLPFLQGVERVATAMRALTVVCVTEDSPVKARIQIDQLVSRGVSGIIAASVGQLVRDELAPGLERSTIPIVYCDQPDLERDSINFDGASAGYEMAMHLALHGHRHITLLAPSLEMPNVAALHSGFQRALATGSVEKVTTHLTNGFTMTAGAQAAQALLIGGERPTAIATAADTLALGVLATTAQLGIGVPDDLALMSYGQIDVAALVNPALSTVAVPAEEMGRLAAERLRDRLSGGAARGRTTLSARLVVRQSCGRHGVGPLRAQGHRRVEGDDR